MQAEWFIHYFSKVLVPRKIEDERLDSTLRGIHRTPLLDQPENNRDQDKQTDGDSDKQRVIEKVGSTLGIVNCAK